MSQYRLSHKARANLSDIWTFIADDSPRTADRFIDRLIARLPTLARHPQMGRRRDDLGIDLRSVPLGKYVIFYRRTDEGIEIVRVLHRARDLPRLLSE